MEYTLRIWQDGELIRHRYCESEDSPPPLIILRRTAHFSGQGYEARLYRGDWDRNANIGIEHLAGEEMISGTLLERMAKFGYTKKDFFFS
jgi:hypothetical protein